MTDPKHYRKHILSLLVENHQGVLAKISSLIAAKGYNIDSLTVAPVEENRPGHGVRTADTRSGG